MPFAADADEAQGRLALHELVKPVGLAVRQPDDVRHAGPFHLAENRLGTGRDHRCVIHQSPPPERPVYDRLAPPIKRPTRVPPGQLVWNFLQSGPHLRRQRQPLRRSRVVRRCLLKHRMSKTLTPNPLRMIPGLRDRKMALGSSAASRGPARLRSTEVTV